MSNALPATWIRTRTLPAGAPRPYVDNPRMIRHIIGANHQSLGGPPGYHSAWGPRARQRPARVRSMSVPASPARTTASGSDDASTTGLDTVLDDALARAKRATPSPAV